MGRGDIQSDSGVRCKPKGKADNKKKRENAKQFDV